MGRSGGVNWRAPTSLLREIRQRLRRMTASQLLGAGLWAVFALIVANVVALANPGLTAGAQPIGRAVGVAFGLGVATAAYGVASWAWNYDTERYYE